MGYPVGNLSNGWTIFSFLMVVSLLVEGTKHRQVAKCGAKCEARGPGMYQNLDFERFVFQMKGGDQMVGAEKWHKSGTLPMDFLVDALSCWKLTT